MKRQIRRAVPDHAPVHGWFQLSYASYLVLPRVLLQEMPVSWQRKFVRLLNEACEAFPNAPGSVYTVYRRGSNGRFEEDPLRNYRHPDYRAIAKARETV